MSADVPETSQGRRHTTRNQIIEKRLDEDGVERTYVYRLNYGAQQMEFRRIDDTTDMATRPEEKKKKSKSPKIVRKLLRKTELRP